MHIKFAVSIGKSAPTCAHKSTQVCPRVGHVSHIRTRTALEHCAREMPWRANALIPSSALVFFGRPIISTYACCSQLSSGGVPWQPVQLCRPNRRLVGGLVTASGTRTHLYHTVCSGDDAAPHLPIFLVGKKLWYLVEQYYSVNARHRATSVSKRRVDSNSPIPLKSNHDIWASADVLHVRISMEIIVHVVHD